MAKNKKRPLIIEALDMRNMYYEGVDPRRRIDRRNSHLAGKDENAFANCYPYGYQTYFPGRKREEY